jgi:hypothetical protein
MLSKGWNIFGNYVWWASTGPPSPHATPHGTLLGAPLLSAPPRPPRHGLTLWLIAQVTLSLGPGSEVPSGVEELQDCASAASRRLYQLALTMGCGASRLPPWHATVTQDWPRFAFTRAQLQGGKYRLDISQGEILGAALCVAVEPFKSKAGYVSVKSVQPYAVTISTTDGQSIAYLADGKQRRLECGFATYRRKVEKVREAGPADTVWSADASSSAGHDGQRSTLPETISVVNTGGRVMVWRGPLPQNAAEAAERGAADLMACILSADYGTPAGTSHSFSMSISEQLASAAARSGELPTLMCIATEGFWSQGARCHSNDVVGVRASSSTADESDVRPNSSVVYDAFNGRSKFDMRPGKAKEPAIAIATAASPGSPSPPVATVVASAAPVAARGVR